MKRFMVFVLLISLLTILAISKIQLEAATFPTDINAKAIIVVDLETGEIHYEKNSKKQVAVAGMSKIMTEYLVFNAIGAHKFDWDSTYTPSNYVLSISEQPSFVNLGMKEDERYTVRQLFKAMSIASANDAAVGLAEMTAQTEEKFIDIMNEHATHFGLNETRFFSASGLDGDEVNLSSARDVSLLARKLILTHPEVLLFTEIPNFRTSAGETKENTNLMLSGKAHEMPGIDGLKTGFTEEAGPCFIGTGVFNGRRIVTVVIGVETIDGDTINPRFELTKSLIERFVF